MGLRVSVLSVSGLALGLLISLGFDLTAAANEKEDQRAAKEQSAKERAAGAPAKTEYLRLLRDDEGRPAELQTAIVRFAPADESRKGMTVDLIAAVHIGEKSYYERLNERFRDYDAVLYELVAPEGTRVPQGGVKSKHPVGRLQTALKDFLDLNFQLDHVDYQSENFVHADMTPEAFSKSMDDRGETVWGLVLRALGRSMAEESKSDDWFDLKLLMALVDKNRALRVKRLLAEQFEDLEGVAAVFDSGDGSTLVTERNKRALEVLAKEIASGKRRLAIFYGAAHMPDMARRLAADFNVKSVEQEWLTAWDLHQPVKATRPKRVDQEKRTTEEK